MTQQKQTPGIAVASLILGILSLILFGLLTAIPAVICGHSAKSKIKQDSENLSGDGMALAGLIMGYVSIAFSVLMIPLMLAIMIPAFVGARDAAQEMSCINNLQMIESAKDMVVIEENLSEGQPIDPVLYLEVMNDAEPICPKDGTYSINPVGVSAACSVHGSLENLRYE